MMKEIIDNVYSVLGYMGAHHIIGVLTLLCVIKVSSFVKHSPWY